MSIEQVIAALAESNLTLAASMDRNTAAATALLEFQAGVTTTTSKTTRKEVGDLAKEETETVTKEPVKTEKKTPAKKKAPAKKEPEPEPEPEADEAAKVTMVEVRAAAMSLRDEIGKGALQASQKAFKVSSIKELGEDQFPMYVRYCEDKLKEADQGV